MSENNVASRGDFRGDFSRDTFDPMKHFSRVLVQQGRVQLDADWNEQVSILLHYMRQLGRDLMGPHGAPRGDDGRQEGDGFKIDQITDEAKTVKQGFSIGEGRYYVDGILCEADKQYIYTEQPYYPLAGNEEELADGKHLVYLDVWERHLSYVEDDYMREKALGGADTATRAQVVWQVKVISDKELKESRASLDLTQRNMVQGLEYSSFISALTVAQKTHPGNSQLKARAKKAPEENNAPCLTAPEASYRGAENQLYRVEIHNGSADECGPSFKWSRENGAVIFPITNIGTNQITLEHLGRDDRFSLQPGDWVEMLDDDVILRNQANDLLQVTEIDRDNLQVTLSAGSPVSFDSKKHPYLRRWDQKKDAGKDGIKITKDKDIPLEDGIEIQFSGDGYQTGDYWLIPARTATGDVEWPVDPVDHTKPAALPPHGVVHHYAPLAIITVADNKVKKNTQGESDNLIDLRRQLKKGWE